MTALAACLQNVAPTAESEIFTKDYVRRISRPCVYLFMKDGEPLYIGSSANGLLRFADPSHHRKEVRSDADEIRVLWFKKTWHDRSAEERLIKKLRPRFNNRERARFSKVAPMIDQQRAQSGAAA